MIRKLRVLSFAAVTLWAGHAVGFSTWNMSIVGISQSAYSGSGVFGLDFQSGNGSSLTASCNANFTGMDGGGATQTTNFQGVCTTQAGFGVLRSYSFGNVTNTYYNASNPPAWDGNNFDPDGSPDSYVSLGFAGFTDTLQFGGALQSGYKARYLFHVSGSNNGYGSVADMSFGIDGYSDESFFAFDPGPVNTIWATQSYDINGITPQDVHVTFSNQFVLNTFDVADGTSTWGESAFQSTVELVGIEITDASGNIVHGVTVTSASGTNYPVPEPSGLVALAAGMALLAKKRRSRQ